MTRFVVSISIIALFSLLLLTVLSLVPGCKTTEFSPPAMVGPSAGTATLGGGETQRLRLLASPSAIVFSTGSGSAKVTIIAHVENDLGQPMPDGTAVTWTTTVGSLSDSTTTASNGQSETVLTFPPQYSGCGTVTAISGDATAFIQVCTELADTSLTLTAGAIEVDAQGSTTLTATVKSYGTPDDGILVHFSIVSGSAYATLSASGAITDGSGNASVTFEGQNTTANNEPVEVKATTNDGRSATITILVRHP